jgi:protein phosphatase
MARKFIEAAGLTDAGTVRQFNEDRIVLEPEVGILALADGMGGHRGGEFAAQMAAQLVPAALRNQLAGPGIGSAAHQHSPLLAVDESIKQANSAIFEAAQADPKRLGMGTTLAVAFFHDNRVILGHIGDSRIYRMRGQVLTLLTRDDSLLRDQVDLGWIPAAEAGASHNRNLVTQALGAAANVSVNLRTEDALPGDVYLLCSDGLNDLVADDDIELIVGALAANLPLAAHHLIQAAKDNGGYDNVSAILARVRRPFPSSHRPPWFARLLGKSH